MVPQSLLMLGFERDQGKKHHRRGMIPSYLAIGIIDFLMVSRYFCDARFPFY